MSYSNHGEDAINDAICNNTSLAVAQLYVKLHIGDPGEDCTANPAVETSRQAVDFDPSSGGTCLSSNAPTWASVAATETFTHFSLWDDPTAGNPWGYGPLTAPKPVNATDTTDFPVGALSFTSD